ncbi:iron chaperone [Salinicoccus halodurans]|uniref:YdhG-like domain-containing protein n=1 Tax=Salinicoccus halodurans TaxID=407035 RepID=A0A0F7D4M8_9STAP|nr:DUF1801 domain-containing protein [Salinicoccus halodurans]AKG74510.1 hypothetical protein AAT16_10095 [Salinicoccus halodurans]SFK90547.1 hypothetical protein SAMN05216235_2442 [Salinicoccus halodurans]
MQEFEVFLNKLDDQDVRFKIEEVLQWISDKYPGMGKTVKWNQPMFTDHGTFIIAFSVAKKHVSVAPETAAIKHCQQEIKEAGHSYTDNVIRITWNEPMDYELLEKLIDFNIEDKKDHDKFWR